MAAQDNTGEILNIRLSRIRPHPRIPNIRGPVRNTADIQPSIRANGIQQPLWVMRADKDGWYWLIDGARRLTAGRAVEVEYAPCIIKEAGDEEVRRLMLIANARQPLPPIVLSPRGEVIGGICLAVHEEIKAGRKRHQIAPDIGHKVTADVVGAYERLYHEIEAIQRRVACDQLKITVYSLMKTQRPEVKAYILQKKGNISANYVRQVIANWATIAADLERKAQAESVEEDEEVERVEVATVAAAPQTVQTTPALLNMIYSDLKRVKGRLLNEVERYILEVQIKTLVEEILRG